MATPPPHVHTTTPPIATKTISFTSNRPKAVSILDYNVVNRTSKKKQRLLLYGELQDSQNLTKLILRNLTSPIVNILELPVSSVTQMLRNGNTTISIRYVKIRHPHDPTTTDPTTHHDPTTASLASPTATDPSRSSSPMQANKLDLSFISKEDCSEFVVSLSLLLPALKLGNEYFRIDAQGNLVYEVYTLSKKGKRQRTLVLNPNEGTLTRLLSNGAVKGQADIWSANGLHLVSVPEHENRRLTYNCPGARTCDVEFSSAAIRSDFVSNVRKIARKLPLEAEFSMAEFKALQTVLVKVLESFRARLTDPALLRIDTMRFLGRDVRIALLSDGVYQVIRERFPETVAVVEDPIVAKEELVDRIGAKFLQYGIMNDTKDDDDAGGSQSSATVRKSRHNINKRGNRSTRLIFRELGTYRFSTGGFGTVFDVCTATWNVGEKKPPTPRELRHMVRPGADIYAIGLQECAGKHVAKWVQALQLAIGAAGLSDSGKDTNDENTITITNDDNTTITNDDY